MGALFNRAAGWSCERGRTRAAAVRALPPERAGLASGMNNSCRQGAGALGVAIHGAVTGSPTEPARCVRGLQLLGIAGDAEDAED